MTHSNPPTSTLSGITTTAAFGIMSIFLVALMFFIPPAYKAPATILLASIVAIAMLAQKQTRVLDSLISRGYMLSVFVLGMSVFLILLLSPYPKSELAINVCFLLFASVCLGVMNRGFGAGKIAKTIFYFAGVAGIIIALFLHSASLSPMYCFGSYDKNYFGVVLFLFFCWCWFEKRLFGLVICVAASFLLNSRALQLMIVLFVVISIVVRVRFSSSILFKSPSPVILMTAFVAMTIVIVAFSSWWTTDVVGSSTVSSALASRGLNDTSNAIRFNSNMYAVDQLFDDPSLLIMGYDSDISTSMNIGNPLEGDNMAFMAARNGYRVVQPHHAVLNLLLKHGLLFTVGYLLVFCFSFSKYFTIGAACVWVPYLTIGMVMHSTLTAQYLLMFVFLLVSANNDLSTKGIECLQLSWITRLRSRKIGGRQQ